MTPPKSGPCGNTLPLAFLCIYQQVPTYMANLSFLSEKLMSSTFKIYIETLIDLDHFGNLTFKLPK